MCEKEIGTERERETERQRDRHRHRETQRDTERQTERERQRGQREREREREDRERDLHRFFLYADIQANPGLVSCKGNHQIFGVFKRVCAAVYPDACVAPGLFVAGSDSKWFWKLAPQIYRFNPIRIHASQTGTTL